MIFLLFVICTTSDEDEVLLLDWLQVRLVSGTQGASTSTWGSSTSTWGASTSTSWLRCTGAASDEGLVWLGTKSAMMQ